MECPDFSRMDLRELTAWEAAVRLAIAALEHAGGAMPPSSRTTRGSREWDTVRGTVSPENA